FAGGGCGGVESESFGHLEAAAARHRGLQQGEAGRVGGVDDIPVDLGGARGTDVHAVADVEALDEPHAATDTRARSAAETAKPGAVPVSIQYVAHWRPSNGSL